MRFIGLSNNAARCIASSRSTARPAPAIELYRNCARYITISGFAADRPTCPVLAAARRFLRHAAGAVRQRQPATRQWRRYRSTSTTPDRSTQIDYEDLIQNGAPEGERSEKFQAVVWHLAGTGLVDRADRRRARRSIPTASARNTPTGCWPKSHARMTSGRPTSGPRATGSAAAADAPWPQIQIVPGELPRVVNEAEDALLLLGREIYQRGGLLVRPVLTKFKASTTSARCRAGSWSR